MEIGCISTLSILLNRGLSSSYGSRLCLLLRELEENLGESAHSKLSWKQRGLKGGNAEVSLQVGGFCAAAALRSCARTAWCPGVRCSTPGKARGWRVVSRR